MSSEQGGSCWWSLDVWYPIHEAGQDREGPPSHQAASAGSPIPPTVEAVGGRSSRLWNAPARKVSSSNATRKLVGMSLLATWLSWFGCFAHRWHLWTCWRETMEVVVDEDIRWHLYKWPSSPNSGHNSYQRQGFMRCNCVDCWAHPHEFILEVSLSRRIEDERWARIGDKCFANMGIYMGDLWI